jgi:hypothetical protein
LDKATGVEQDVQFPVLLAHEFIQHLVDKIGDRIDVCQVTNATDQHIATAVEEWCAHVCVDKRMVVPIGLHGKGVHFKAKMRDSLERFIWSSCCQPQAPRMVYTAIPKSALVG